MAHQHVAGHPKNMYELLAQLFGQLWHDFKKITDKAEVSHLEDRGLFILVDRNNHFGIFHASQMLNGAGNTDGNIEIRRYDFAGLAHLPIIRCVARVHGCARGTNGGTQFIGQGFDDFEIIFRSNTTTTGDNNAR